MAGKKVQVVILAEEDVRQRLDALRIVRGESRARVAEYALTHGGINALEAGHVRELARLQRLAERARMPWRAYVDAYAEAFSRQTYGPGLDALEEDDSAVTGIKPTRKVKPVPAAKFTTPA